LGINCEHGRDTFSLRSSTIIHIKLSGKQKADREDPMGREWYGYTEQATVEELFENNRGRWVLGKRAEIEEYAVFSFTGDHKVKFVAAIDGFEDFDGKRAIVGSVLPAEHPLAAQWVGKSSPDSHRNPTTYHDDPRECGCGCGEPVKGGRSFVPGHDQRAIHARIERQWGDTLGFIRWFDETYGRVA
jgi:hypothetical protein